MADGWKCATCGTTNDDARLLCANCGAIRHGAIPDEVMRSAWTGGADSAGAAAELPPPAQPAGNATGALEGTSPDSPPGPAGLRWTGSATSEVERGLPAGAPVPPIPPTSEDAADRPSASTAPVWAIGPGSPPPPDSYDTPRPNSPPQGGPSPGWTAWSDGSTPARRSRRLRLPIGLLLFGLLIGAGAVGSTLFGAGRSSTGEINRGGDLYAGDLRVGDCFDVKDQSVEQVNNVTARPCGQPHQYEVFFVEDLPDGAFPDDAAFQAHVNSDCDPAFAGYVGVPYDQSALEVLYFVPTQASWNGGDRSIQCAVYDPDSTSITGSLKGADR